MQMLNKNSQALLKVIAILTGLCLNACGVFVGNPENEDPTNPPKVTASTPADTTGAAVPVALRLVSNQGSTAATALQTAPSIDLGNGMLLSDAKLHVGRFKIKSEKDESKEEIEFQDELDKKRLEQESEGDEDDVAEQELKDIEDKYDELISEASSDEEKQQLEDQRDAEKDAKEQELASLKDAKEKTTEELENDQDHSLIWKDTFYYDVVNDSVSPAIPEMSILDGSYRRIEFKVKPSRSTTDHQELLNRSVTMSGSFTAGSITTGFRFATKEEMKFSLRGSSGLAVGKSAKNEITIAFDAVSWFAGVDITKATPSADGFVDIDEANNTELYDAILGNMSHSTKFGSDEDGDGKLGEDESKGETN